MWSNEANLVAYQIIFNWQLFCIRLIQYLRNSSLTTCPYAKLKRISFISEFGVPAVNLKIACDWERVGIKIPFYIISQYEISKFKDLAGI